MFISSFDGPDDELEAGSAKSVEELGSAGRLCFVRSSMERRGSREGGEGCGKGRESRTMSH